MTAHPFAPIALGDLTLHFLVEGSEPDGSVAVFRCELAAGGRAPAAHSHVDVDATVHGLTGVTTWTIDGVAVELRAGESLFIRRGAAHGFSAGDCDASVLCVAAPGGVGPAYFRELGAAGEDRDAIAAVMRRHGLTPA